MANITERLRKLEVGQQREVWGIDSNEQYSRRDNVRIFGIKETPNEDTTQLAINLANSIGVNLNRKDISVSHRLGPMRRSSKKGVVPPPRPIIVKLVRREDKISLMKNKNKLTKKKKNEMAEDEFNIIISDDLTNARNRMRRALQDDSSIDRVGLVNGRLVCSGKDQNGDWTVTINTPEDLVTKLNWSMADLEANGLLVDDSPLEYQE